MKASSLMMSAIAVLALACFTMAPVAEAYPVEHLPRGNTTVFGIQPMANGNLFVAALGVDGQIWRVYQTGPTTWTDWAPLTQFCPWINDTQRPCVFDADPVLARNTDGRLEVFARFHGNLDLWQTYMVDAANPDGWTVPRESSCVDEAQDTGLWYCLCPTGLPKNVCTYPAPNYWNSQPIFPTSDITAINSPADGRIVLYFRGFEGHLYYVQQAKPGSSDLYQPPTMFAVDTLFV